MNLRPASAPGPMHPHARHVLPLILTMRPQFAALPGAGPPPTLTQVIPTYYATFTLSCIIGAAIVYREFEGLTFGQLFLFFIGLCLSGIGVFTVSNKSEEEKGVQMRAVDDEEGANTAGGGPSASRQQLRGEGARLVEMDELRLSTQEDESGGADKVGAGANATNGRELGSSQADARLSCDASDSLPTTPAGSNGDLKGAAENGINGYSKVRSKEEEEEDARRGEEARRYFSVGRSDTLSRNSFAALPQSDRLFSPSLS